jgi:hypothetical protein
LARKGLLVQKGASLVVRKKLLVPWEAKRTRRSATSLRKLFLFCSLNNFKSASVTMIYTHIFDEEVETALKSSPQPTTFGTKEDNHLSCPSPLY